MKKLKKFCEDNLVFWNWSPGPFEKPQSRGGSRQDVPAPLPLKDHMIQQADVDMLIDEELALWPESGWVFIG